MSGFEDHKWDEDEDWLKYRANLTIPPGRDEEPIVLRKKHQFYKNNIDSSHQVPASSSRPSSSTQEDSGPPPPPGSERGSSERGSEETPASASGSNSSYGGNTGGSPGYGASNSSGRGAESLLPAWITGHPKYAQLMNVLPSMHTAVWGANVYVLAMCVWSILARIISPGSVASTTASATRMSTLLYAFALRQSMPPPGPNGAPPSLSAFTSNQNTHYLLLLLGLATAPAPLPLVAIIAASALYQAVRLGTGLENPGIRAMVKRVVTRAPSELTLVGFVVNFELALGFALLLSMLDPSNPRHGIFRFITWFFFITLRHTHSELTRRTLAMLLGSMPAFARGPIAKITPWVVKAANSLPRTLLPFIITYAVSYYFL